MEDIEQNVKNLLSRIPETNSFGEKVTLVAAVKTQSVEAINRAICAGVTDIGDNHAQEFKDKYGEICGNPRRHFIGHLQTNKIKYLLGKVDLYHSLDRFPLAQELSFKGERAGISSNVLMQINIGNEESKSGFAFEEAEEQYSRIAALPALKICGLMAMLPETDDKKTLETLALKMRGLYDRLRAGNDNFKHLSMGMSGDWEICVECGSNMIRLGTAIFGARNYNLK